MPSDPILNELDSNHDGVISSTEIAAADKSLLATDIDHDGEISADEMRVRPPSAEEQPEHLLGECDTNKDGNISKAEAPDRLQQQFDSIDTNHEGRII
jgi:Ca2+-binding EF-hand superfamily protein